MVVVVVAAAAMVVVVVVVAAVSSAGGVVLCKSIFVLTFVLNRAKAMFWLFFGSDAILVHCASKHNKQNTTKNKPNNTKTTPTKQQPRLSPKQN